MSKADEEFGGDLKKKFHKKIMTNCMSWFFRTLFSAHFFFFFQEESKKEEVLKIAPGTRLGFLLHGFY